MTPDWCEDKKSPSVDQEGFHISTNFQDPCHTNSDVIKSAEGQKHLKLTIDALHEHNSPTKHDINEDWVSYQTD